MAPESEMMVYWVFTQQLYHFIHYIQDSNLERLPVPNHSKQSAHLYKCNTAHKVAFDCQCARHIVLWAGGLFNKSAPGHLLHILQITQRINMKVMHAFMKYWQFRFFVSIVTGMNNTMCFDTMNIAWSHSKVTNLPPTDEIDFEIDTLPYIHIWQN